MSDETPTGFDLGQYGNKRRNVLKTLGATGLTGVALTGNAAASHGNTGGNMLTGGEPHVGVPFRAYDYFGVDVDLPASCHATESQLKRYSLLFIVYPSLGSGQLAAIRNNKMKHFDATGGTEYEFNSKQSCKDASGVWRSSFGLA